MEIVNLNHVDFPFGKEFYIKNSLYPRMLVYCEALDITFVVCPQYGEAITLEDFVNNWAYSFYKVPGEEDNPDYLGVTFEQP